MTRNCPKPEYLFASVRSFFPRRDLLTPGMEVFSLRQSEPFSHCLGLVDLEQLGERLRSEAHQDIICRLTREEKKIFAAFSYPKRQIEWLGGRIAGKAAALLLLTEDIAAERMTTVEILPRDNGSPGLGFNQAFAQRPSLSISHSGKYAAGLAARAPVCGVDLQEISSKTEKVASRFAAPGEIRLLADKIPALNCVQRLSLLWSAKEAVKKAALSDRPVLFQGVLLTRLEVGRWITLYLQYPGKDIHPARVTAVVLNDYILAFTGGPENHAGTS